MMRGHALRYLGWQVWDRTGPRVLVMWLIASVICLPLHFAAAQNPQPPAQIQSMAQQLHFQLAILAVVVLFHGIVGEDRQKGYYRFYLAKPVSPLHFYGQSALLALLAMLTFTTGFLVMFSLAVAPAWEWRLLVSSLSLGLLIGGMIFFISTLSMLDWMWMTAVVIAASYLRNRFPRDDSTLGRVLHAVLPPNHLVDERVLTVEQWAWIGGWGLGLFALGLLVLRFRPLGED